MHPARIRTALVLAVAACVATSAPRAREGQSAGAMLAPVRDPQAAPPPNIGSAVIAGVVVAADSGRPVRRARVSLSAIQPRVSKSATSDDQGRFTFTDLPAGEFDLTTSKLGFLDMAYGQKRPGIGQSGTAIRLLDRQRLENLTIAIPRGGVLTGTVVDEQGEPAFGTQVRALRYVIRTGERVLQPAGTATADDRGIYRIPSLSPGEYVVLATPRDNSEQMQVEEMMMRVEQVAVAAKVSGVNADTAATQAKLADQMAMAKAGLAGALADTDQSPTPGFAPVYYPGTTAASGATSVTLGVSEERGNVNMQLPLVMMARVSGTVTSAQPLPPGAQVQLMDTTQALPGLNVRTTRVGPDGKFSFSSVPPGQYTLSARVDVRPAVDKQALLRMERAVEAKKPEAVVMSLAPAAPAETLWARSDVSIDGRSLSNVDLPLRSAMSALGAIAFDGAAPRPPDLTRLRVAMVSIGLMASGDTLTAIPDANGRFKLTGLVPGRYRVQASGGTGWRLATAMVGGRDALDTMIEVKPGEDIAMMALTFSDRSTALSGTMQDAAGRPTSDYTIVAFSADQRFWTPQSRRITATRPATDGRFSFRDLPPGDYRLAAVVDAEPGQWYDAAFLRQLVGASIQVTLSDGEKKTQDLRAGR